MWFLVGIVVVGGLAIGAALALGAILHWGLGEEPEDWRGSR